MVGRLPAHSVAQITAYTAKLSAWFSSTGQQLGTDPAVFTRAFNHNGVPAYVTAFTADSLISALPCGTSVQRADVVDLGNDWPWPVLLPTDSVYSQTIMPALSGGADLVVWNVNASGETEYDFFRSFACEPGIIPELPITTRPFVSVGLSCGFNNYDMTEPVGQGICTGTGQPPPRTIPLVETMMFQPNRGMIAQVGPTRASYALANRLFGMAFLKRFYEPGSTLGRAFLLAQRECIVKYPQYREPLSSYVLLGDPRLGPTTITGVPETSAPPVALRMSAHPNPFNPSTIIEYFSSRPARVELKIYDTRGRAVRRLIHGGLASAGWSRVQWNGRTDSGSAVASGVYFARLLCAGRSTTTRLVVLR